MADGQPKVTGQPRIPGQLTPTRQLRAAGQPRATGQTGQPTAAGQPMKTRQLLVHTALTLALVAKLVDASLVRTEHDGIAATERMLPRPPGGESHESLE